MNLCALPEMLRGFPFSGSSTYIHVVLVVVVVVGDVFFVVSRSVAVFFSFCLFFFTYILLLRLLLLVKYDIRVLYWLLAHSSHNTYTWTKNHIHLFSTVFYCLFRSTGLLLMTKYNNLEHALPVLWIYFEFPRANHNNNNNDNNISVARSFFPSFSLT